MHNYLYICMCALVLRLYPNRSVMENNMAEGSIVCLLSSILIDNYLHHSKDHVEKDGIRRHGFCSWLYLFLVLHIWEETPFSPTPL